MLNVVVIRGRTHTDKNHKNPPCINAKYITEIQSYGYNILKDVCTKCPHFFEKENEEAVGETCEYLLQFEEGANVRIYTHTSLCLKRSLDTSLPDRVVIDERFYTNMINIQSVRLKMVKELIDDRYGLNKVIYQALAENRPMLTYLKKHYKDKLSEVLQKAKDSIEIYLPELDGDKPSSFKNIRKLIEQRYIPEKQTLLLLLNNIIQEIDKFTDRRNPLSIRLEDDEVIVTTHSTFTRFLDPDNKMVPVLNIDADYCQNVAEVFLPNIKHREFYVERQAYITQIYSTTNAKTRFIPRKDDASDGKIDKAAKQRINDTQQLLENIHRDYGNFLLIGYQELVGNPKNGNRSKFNLPKGCEAIHFGGLRGLNKYKNFETAVVIGRNQLPINAIEMQAAALYWDSGKQLELTGEMRYETSGFRMRNGEMFGVDVMTCNDPFAQELQELHRECETLQGIDRLRLMHTGHHKTMRNVFVLSNLPLDLTVDQLVSLKQLNTWRTAIEKALLRSQHKVLPLSAAYLVKEFGYLFANESSVKNKVRAEGLSETIQNIKQFGKKLVFNNENYNLFTYRVLDESGKGVQGKPQKALSTKSITIGKARQHLQKMFGGKIEIVETTQRTIMDIKVVEDEFEWFWDSIN